MNETMMRNMINEKIWKNAFLKYLYQLMLFNGLNVKFKI